jgi:arginase
VGGVEHAAARHPRLAVVWLDAHPDLHTPATSPSGAFSGMALRSVLGEGGHDLVLASPVPAGRVVLVGARDYDGAEEDAVARAGLVLIEPSALSDDRVLLEAVVRTGADAVYVHVDLDVLDPSAMTGVSASVPFGVAVAELVAAIKRLRSEVPLAGCSIAGFSPGSPSDAVADLGAILRLVGALA